MKHLSLVLVFLIGIALVSSMPKVRSGPRGPRLNRTESLEYLYRLQYTDSPRATEIQADRAIRAYQRRFRLKVTGLLDEDTQEQMTIPRCGSPDEPNSRGKRSIRVKRAFSGRGWTSTALTYRISEFGSVLSSNTITSEDHVGQIVEAALQIWSDVTDLTFERLGPNDDVDMDIAFVRRNHGDGTQNAFDGPNGILAHAFFPPSSPVSTPTLDGDSHFDDEEDWSDRTIDGINLFWVAVHEFGHALGLNHSLDTSSVMYAFYTGYDPNLSLSEDDIRSIQSAGYGTGPASTPTSSSSTASTPTSSSSTASTPTSSSSTASTPTSSSSTASTPTSSSSTASTPTSSSSTASTPTSSTPSTSSTTPATPTPPEYCGENARVDAITTFSDGFTYIFRGEEFWKRSSAGVITGPMVTTEHWSGLEPGPIDSALRLTDSVSDDTYLIQGSAATKYAGTMTSQERIGFPIRGGRRRARQPTPVTAAFVQSGTTYLLNRGKRVYKLESDLSAIPAQERTVSRLTKGAFNTGRVVDAAFTDDEGNTFLFSGNQYYLRAASDGVTSRFGEVGTDFLGCPAPPTAG